jgi:hypothetical protein
VALASYHLLDIEDWLSGSMKSLGYGTQERVSWDVQSTSRKEYAYSCSEDMKLLEDSSICCNWSWHPIACWDAPYKLTIFKSLFQKTQTQWGIHDPINTWNQQNVVVSVFTLLVFWLSSRSRQLFSFLGINRLCLKHWVFCKEYSTV